MIRKTRVNPIVPYMILGFAILGGLALIASFVMAPQIPVTSGGASQARRAPALSRAQQADAARYEAAAEAFQLQRARQAEVNRLNGLAAYYGMETSRTVLSRAQRAEADRLTAAANAYILQNAQLPRAQLADAARWTGMAIQVGQTPTTISPALKLLLGR